MLFLFTRRQEIGQYAGELHTERMQYDARGKVLLANNQASVFQNWYSGGGSLVGTDWRGLGTQVGRIPEEFQLDPLGNNSATSTSGQHGYRIFNSQTGETIKYGISGQPLNRDGSSPRANGQVNSKPGRRQCLG